MKNLIIGNLITRNEAKSIKGGLSSIHYLVLAPTDNDEQSCTAYCGKGKAAVTYKGNNCHARDYDGCETSDGATCC